MGIRESLIIDIESFIKNAIELYNVEEIVKKSEYVNLEKRILTLSKNDFESEKKYEFFLKYVNQPHRCVEKVLFEKEFVEDYLKEGDFLWMCTYFRGIVDRMK